MWSSVEIGARAVMYRKWIASSRVSLITAVFAGSAALAQASPAAAAIPPPPGAKSMDEVRLQSGGLVRGSVKELVPGQYVTITDGRSGEAARFEWSEVDAVVQWDGTVIGQDFSGELPTPKPKPGEAEPFPEPDPDPEPDPFPEPDPEPDPEVEPDPEPEPEPDPEPEPEPEPEPDESPAGGPSPSSPQLVIDVRPEGPPVSLRRDGGEALCEAPCEQQIGSPDGRFVLESEGKQFGKPFELPAGDSNYRIDAKRKNPALLWSGVALIPATIIVGVGVGIIPALNNVPAGQIAGYAAGGAAIGVLGIAGGVTLIMFSRSKVKVFPGTTAQAPIGAEVAQ